MNDNKMSITVPSFSRNEIEIDLLDMLSDLLLKWKTVLAFLLIGAILGCGRTMLLGNDDTEPVTAEDLDRARAQVAADKALAVDQLFLQYISYKELQEDIRAYYSDFLAVKLSEDDVVKVAARYFVTSTIENLGSILPDFTLTEKIYDALREIAPDEEWGSRIYDRVWISTASNSRITVSNLNDDSVIPIQYLFTVSLYGNSEEQCQEMLSIVDEALDGVVASLRSLDSDISITSAGYDYNFNTFDYVNTLRKGSIDKMAIAESEMTSLNSKVSALSSVEKEYYNLLLQQYNEQFAVEQKVSWKKWTVIGALIGAVLAAGIIMFTYLLDGKVKSAVELEYCGPMLHRVYVKGKKNLFGKWAAALIRAGDTDPAAEADIVSADLSILMKKNGKSSLLLLCEKNDADAFAFAEQVKARLQVRDDALRVRIANPLESVQELELAAQADVCVMFAELKKSRRSVLHEWDRICARYMLPSAGAVAVRRCW